MKTETKQSVLNYSSSYNRQGQLLLKLLVHNHKLIFFLSQGASFDNKSCIGNGMTRTPLTPFKMQLFAGTMHSE